MYTEGYEGFYHLDSMRGTVEEARMDYIIRDHSKEKFEEKKAFMERVTEYLNSRYHAGTVELLLKDSYYNMKEKIQPHMYLIDVAKASMEEIGIEPKVTPIRGGTDGARLSYEGLPVPTCAQEAIITMENLSSSQFSPWKRWWSFFLKL